MLITTNAIVLSKLKYKDNDLIVKCYTQNLGVVSFLLRGILKSKKANTKAAYFQPLSQVQLSISYKENRSLQSVSDTKMNHVYNSLHTHVLKSAIVMFLSEIYEYQKKFSKHSHLRETQQPPIKFDLNSIGVTNKFLQKSSNKKF